MLFRMAGVWSLNTEGVDLETGWFGREPAVPAGSSCPLSCIASVVGTWLCRAKPVAWGWTDS